MERQEYESSGQAVESGDEVVLRLVWAGQVREAAAPCSPVGFHGSSHHAETEVERDGIRNSLLGAVRWTALRLRSGAAEGMACHFGARDVVVESSSSTKAAQAALLEALRGFKPNRKPRARVSAKAASPRPARRRSNVIHIGEYK